MSHNVHLSCTLAIWMTHVAITWQRLSKRVRRFRSLWTDSHERRPLPFSLNVLHILLSSTTTTFNAAHYGSADRASPLYHILIRYSRHGGASLRLIHPAIAQTHRFVSEPRFYSISREISMSLLWTTSSWLFTLAMVAKRCAFSRLSSLVLTHPCSLLLAVPPATSRTTSPCPVPGASGCMAESTSHYGEL